MRKIGILLETKDGALKKANFGVITAARRDGHELYGFLLDGSGYDHKPVLEEYGIHKIVEIKSREGLLDWNPASWALATSAQNSVSRTAANMLAERVEKSERSITGGTPWKREFGISIPERGETRSVTGHGGET